MVLATWFSRISNLTRRIMGSTAYAAYNNGAANANSPHTVTALGRWSILNKQLPAVGKIKAIHVYDFDNTLFKTPLPNPKIWNGPTIGTLSNPDVFVNGGWWHDSRILAATGEGIAKEEPRAWNGWWNDTIVELIQLSTRQKDALCILLTGRSESGFADLIKRMVTSKGLEFDMISLKPAVGPNNERFANTMIFKQKFLEALMETYRHAEEMRIYEDRIKHVKGFRDFLDDYNIKKINGMEGPATRGPIKAEVIQVADMATYLDPVVEVAEVQQIIKDHNAALSSRRRGTRGERLAIKRTVFYTGYMIHHTHTQRLLTLAQIPQNLPESELKFHANNIMICPRPCPPSILDKVGGLGNKVTWEVTGTACFENTVWAARVHPVPGTARFHTGDPVPLVVLALRKGARHVDAGKIRDWQPVPPEKALRFETTVAEKALLRIEEDAAESPFSGRALNKRKRTAAADDFRARPTAGPPQQQHRHFHGQASFAGGGGGGRGGGSGRGGFRGGGGGGASSAANRGFRGGGQRGGAPRGRGGRGAHGAHGGQGGAQQHHHHYRSLDDLGARETQGGFAQMYEDNPRRGGFQGQGRQQQQHIPTGPANLANAGYYGQHQPASQYQGGYQQAHQQQARRPVGGSGPGAGGGPGLSDFY